MRKIILLLLSYSIFLSCSNIDRNKSVDKAKLIGRDYRLFQGTPAWELAKAVQDEDEKMIGDIVAKSPALINYQESKYGNTLLMLAIMNQQTKAFNALLRERANLTIHNTFNGASALIIACSSNHYDNMFAETLIDYGADVNDVETGQRREGNSTRFTPLMAASREGSIYLVKLLLLKGAAINYTNEFGQTCLSQCVLQDQYKIALFLLENGANYKRPIFYRPDYSVPSELQDPNGKGKPMYLVDVLREDFFDLDTDEYKYKMRIVDFLKTKGIDYRATPVPEYIKKRAQEEYPKDWKRYLGIY